MDIYFFADSVSRRLRHLHLAARPVQRVAISVGAQLALHFAALDRARGLRLYRLAPFHPAPAHPRPSHLRHGRELFGKSLVSRIFRRWSAGLLVSSWRRHLEFSLQVGTR